jgi:GT2 family glycosyltransferase
MVPFPPHGPAVSLVATVLNEASSITTLLDSIDAQTQHPDEVVLVDGGSTDGTAQILERWAADRPHTRVIAAPGANISQGRNRAIRAATGEILAVTDAGVRLDPTWLAELLRPFATDPTSDVVAGFFQADPHSLFEQALGATVLPTAGEIDPAAFLPSSRSVAFRRQAWETVGGYPEWLDYCEDLVFDMALRDAGFRFVWAPRALVHFRSRSSPATFFRQYFRYARGDGKADLWRKRHAIRYATYLVGLVFLGQRRHPLARTLLAAGGALYLGRPVQRLWRRKPASLAAAGRLAVATALVPAIRLIGDGAKMAGYPAGVAWRIAGERDIAERSAAAPDPGTASLAPTHCDLTVIVVNYNTRERLRCCLESIERSERPPSMETFVVDNNSHDGSAEMVAADFPWVRLICSSVNGGFAYANNLALSLAGGRAILLLNPDTEVEKTALNGLMETLAQHSDVGVVGPKLLLGDGRLDLACRRSFPSPEVALYRMMGLSRLFPHNKRFGRYNMTYLDPDEPTEVDAISGACMLVRREAIEQAGLLDERFFMYGEDLDWAYRIKAQGWRIRYNPAVTVVHFKGEASRQASERATVAFYRAMHLFYAKHYRGASPLGLDWLIVASIYGRLAWSLTKNALRAPERRRVTT